MGQTNCPGCGATVDVVKDVTTGQMVALDPNPVDDADAKRYVYVSREPQVTRVAENAPGFYFPAHDCPGLQRPV